MAGDLRASRYAHVLRLAILLVATNFRPSPVSAETVTGSCAKAVNTCAAGTVTGSSDNGTTTTWTCKGADKGASAACSAPDPAINGVCAAKAGTCTAGIVTGLSDNGTAISWTCSGINRGLGAWCSVAKQLPSPVNGVCGKKPGSCEAGTVTGLTDNGTSTSWTCSGVNQGLGAWCNVPDQVAAPVNGVCGKKSGECAAGTVTGLTDNGTSTSWTCSGANKGVGAWCNVPDPVVPPVNGVCGTAPASCTAGTVTGVTDNGTSTSWTCSGANKGLGAWCTVRHSAVPANH